MSKVDMGNTGVILYTGGEGMNVLRDSGSNPFSYKNLIRLTQGTRRNPLPNTMGVLLAWMLFFVATTFALASDGAATEAETEVYRLAVANFSNVSNSNSFSFLSHGIAESLSTKFLDNHDLVLIERSQFDQILREQGLSLSEVTEDTTLLNVGRIVNANYLLVGSYQIYQEKLYVTARILEIGSGQGVAGAESTCDLKSGNDVFSVYDQLYSILNGRLRERLGLGAGVLAAAAAPMPVARDIVAMPLVPSIPMSAVRDFDRGNKAALQRNRSNLRGALDYYDSALLQAPGFRKARIASAITHMRLAYLLRQDGMARDSEKEVQTGKAQLAAHGIDRADAMLVSAYLCYLEQDTTGAKSAARAVLKEQPNNCEAHVMLGSILAASNPEAGIREFEKALSLNPTYLPGLVAMVQVHATQRNGQEALVYAEKAVDLYPKNEMARYALAKALGAAKRSSEAVAEFDQALRLNQDFHRARFSKALEYYRNDQTDPSLDAMRDYFDHVHDLSKEWKEEAESLLAAATEKQLKHIRFGFDRDDIALHETQKLDNTIALLKRFPEIEKVTLIGHTDSAGSAAYNQNLSLRRVASIKNYFVAQKLVPERFETVGRGEIEPIGDNRTEVGQTANRRVEIRISLDPTRREESEKGYRYDRNSIMFSK
jgi:outer membrane protein OmpA-like peptidoglycan-associated protein/TolB-like protein